MRSERGAAEAERVGEVVADAGGQQPLALRAAAALASGWSCSANVGSKQFAAESPSCRGNWRAVQSIEIPKISGIFKM